MSLKAPTSILLNPDQKFHAFGYDADQRYTELAQKGLNKEWYYFQKFKMKLQGNMVRHMTYCYIGIRHMTYCYNEGKKNKCVHIANIANI